MKVALACVCAALLSGGVFAQGSAQHLAIVIDCSAQNKRAFEHILRQAGRTIQRLTEKDAVSVVVFDDAAELLVPATPASDKAPILEKIKNLKPKGRKALFAGIAKGAEDLRRNASEGRTKRMLVLSGNGSGALIGPSSPDDIRILTEALAKEKIAVVTPQDGRRPSGRRNSHPRRPVKKKEKGGAAKGIE